MPKKTSTTAPHATPVSKSPDWSYWGNLATVSLREALQLSLGLDPHSHVPASEPDMPLRELYWNRLLITKNHALDADWVVGRVDREDGDISPENTEVYLKKFAVWITNETTLEPFPNDFRNLVATQKKASLVQPQGPQPNLQQIHLCLNRDKESKYYFATQPIAVLEDFMRIHENKLSRAAQALGIDRRVLGRVIKNRRAGRGPWSDQ